MKKIDQLYARFVACFPDVLRGAHPTWRSVQQAGQALFKSQGLPSKKWEAYRYTPFEMRWATALATQPHAVSAGSPRLVGQELAGHHVVIKDHRLYLPSTLPQGVTVRWMNTDVPMPHYVQAYVGKCAQAERDPFVALNTGLFTSLLYVAVEERVVIEQPIFIHHMADVTQPIYHPRALLFFGKRSEAHVVDVVYGGGHPCWVNQVSERFLAEGASITHALWQLDAHPNLYQCQHDHTVLAAHSRLTAFTVTLGSHFVRNDRVATLAGSHSAAHFYGSYFAEEKNHIENHNKLVHTVPYTQGKTCYKGVGVDHGTGVFHGVVDVKRAAQKTATAQYHHGWLLDRAHIYTRPELMIDADDVVCAHGATVGQGIEEALFYLRTRGIPLKEAQQIILTHFLTSALSTSRFKPFLATAVTEACARYFGA